MYITKKNLLVDVLNSRNLFHLARNWKIGHKMYITKKNLLVDVLNSRNLFHLARNWKIGHKMYITKKNLSWCDKLAYSIPFCC